MLSGLLIWENNNILKYNSEEVGGGQVISNVCTVEMSKCQQV